MCTRTNSIICRHCIGIPDWIKEELSQLMTGSIHCIAMHYDGLDIGYTDILRILTRNATYIATIHVGERWNTIASIYMNPGYQMIV